MRTFVESCFQLSTCLLKKDLRLAREHKAGVDGFFNISYGNIGSAADYYIEYGGEYDYLVINYDAEPQRIRLAESELRYGPRSWFLCDCNRRVSKLYLPPNGKLFKCRNCHDLAYELTTFNRKSKMGQLAYRTNRMIKLSNTRQQMRSIFYNGKFNQRFMRFLRFSDSAGFNFNVDVAMSLLKAVNDMK